MERRTQRLRIGGLLSLVVILGVSAGCANVTPAAVINVPGSAVLDYPIPPNTPVVAGSPVYPFWQPPWVTVCMQTRSRLQMTFNDAPRGTSSLHWNGVSIDLVEAGPPGPTTWTTVEPLDPGCGRFDYQPIGDELNDGPSFRVDFAAVP